MGLLGVAERRASVEEEEKEPNIVSCPHANKQKFTYTL